MCAYDTTLLDVMRPPMGRSLLPAPARRRSARLEVLVPQCRRATLGLCGVLCAIFLVTSFYRLNDTDLWAHLAYGRWMVDHGRLPTADPLGVADGSQRFVNLPWLAQLLGYLEYRAAGPGGLQLAHALLVTLACGALLAAVRSRGSSLAMAAAAGGVAYVLALPTIGTIRPQLFGLVGMGLVLLAIAQLKKHRAPLVWLPLVVALWANLHGSFMVGLLALSCAAVGRMWDVAVRCGSVPRAWQEPVARRLRLALLLSLAATLLNPVGPALWRNVLQFGQNANLDEIVEWGPTTLRSLTGTLFFGSLLATALMLRQSRRPIRAADVLLVLTFGVATLLSIRMLCWWAMVWSYVAAPHAAAAWQAWRSRRGSLSNEKSSAAPPTAMRTMIAVAVVFVALAWAPPTHELISGHSRSVALVAATDTPLFVADEIRERGLHGRVFAPLQWTDYLLWHTGGAVQPLVYSHVHLIDPATWRDYQALAAGSSQVIEIVDRRQLAYLVLPKSTAAAMAKPLASSGRFRMVYEDQQAMLFEVLPPVVAKKPAPVSAG